MRQMMHLDLKMRSKLRMLPQARCSLSSSRSSLSSLRRRTHTKARFHDLRQSSKQLFLLYKNQTSSIPNNKNRSKSYNTSLMKRRAFRTTKVELKSQKMIQPMLRVSVNTGKISSNHHKMITTLPFMKKTWNLSNHRDSYYKPVMKLINPQKTQKISSNYFNSS